MKKLRKTKVKFCRGNVAQDTWVPCMMKSGLALASSRCRRTDCPMSARMNRLLKIKHVDDSLVISARQRHPLRDELTRRRCWAGWRDRESLLGLLRRQGQSGRQWTCQPCLSYHPSNLLRSSPWTNRNFDFLFGESVQKARAGAEMKQTKSWVFRFAGYGAPSSFVRDL